MKFKKLFGSLLLAASLGTAGSAQIVGIFSTTSPNYVLSADNLAAYLNTQGFTATSSTVLPADFSGFDVVISMRTAFPGSAISTWVAGGGLLITEYVSTDWAALMFGATVVTGAVPGPGTPVTFTAAGLSAGLGADLTNPFSDGGATEVFRTFGSIGTGTVWATRGANIPVIVHGDVGSGDVILIGDDWADTITYLPTDPTALLIRNALRTEFPAATAVPEPSTYGFIGGLLLLALVMRKRFVRRS